MSWREDYIAVDWGTTNRRAYAVDSDGRLTDAFEDGLGLLAVPRGGFDEAAADIRRRLGDRPMLLAGMVGSNRGWREAPYVECPADAADLARNIIWIDPARTGIVPGVSQCEPSDVMRGEEVQVMGAVAAALVPPDALICHPGTHAKWIVMVGGRIGSFRTMMTGELFGLLRQHSILAEQLKGETRVGEAFIRGAEAGLAGEGLLSSLFGIRARHVLGQEDDDAISYASGLLIGCDARAGLRMARGSPVALIGRPDLCALYAAVLGQAGHAATRVQGETAFLAGMQKLKELI